jgi:hypothetical protein
LVTQSEIEAAIEAITAAELAAAVGKLSVRNYATLALEASERVRPRRDLTAAARMRQARARKRAERAVTRAVTPERAVTGDVTRAVTDAVTRASTDDVGNVPGRLAEIIDTDDLLVKLLDAAGGNVHPTATDTSPIAAHLEQGCDLDLDVLPAVHDLLTDPLQPPLKRWDLSWLTAEITRRRDERTGHVTPAPARAAPVRQPAAPPRRSEPPPAAPSFDMDELVAGYRAGNVSWDATRFGPPPGSPGCRVDAGILRANGYR